MPRSPLPLAPSQSTDDTNTSTPLSRRRRHLRFRCRHRPLLPPLRHTRHHRGRHAPPATNRLCRRRRHFFHHHPPLPPVSAESPCTILTAGLPTSPSTAHPPPPTPSLSTAAKPAISTTTTRLRHRCRHCFRLPPPPSPSAAVTTNLPTSPSDAHFSRPRLHSPPPQAAGSPPTSATDTATPFVARLRRHPHRTPSAAHILTLHRRKNQNRLLPLPPTPSLLPSPASAATLTAHPPPLTSSLSTAAKITTTSCLCHRRRHSFHRLPLQSPSTILTAAHLRCPHPHSPLPQEPQSPPVSATAAVTPFIVCLCRHPLPSSQQAFPHLPPPHTFAAHILTLHRRNNHNHLLPLPPTPSLLSSPASAASLHRTV